MTIELKIERIESLSIAAFKDLQFIFRQALMRILIIKYSLATSNSIDNNLSQFYYTIIQLRKPLLSKASFFNCTNYY